MFIFWNEFPNKWIVKVFNPKSNIIVTPRGVNFRERFWFRWIMYIVICRNFSSKNLSFKNALFWGNFILLALSTVIIEKNLEATEPRIWIRRWPGKTWSSTKKHDSSKKCNSRKTWPPTKIRAHWSWLAKEIPGRWCLRSRQTWLQAAKWSSFHNYRPAILSSIL